jgi:hypothetical protein
MQKSGLEKPQEGTVNIHIVIGSGKLGRETAT